MSFARDMTAQSSRKITEDKIAELSSIKKKEFGIAISEPIVEMAEKQTEAIPLLDKGKNMPAI